MKVEAFVDQVLSLAKRYEGRDVEYLSVGNTILHLGVGLPEHVHPMISEVLRYAATLTESEDIGAPEDSQRFWSEIRQLATDYRANSWHTTEWAVTATYLEENERQQSDRGYSVIIERRLGSVKILCGHPGLRGSIQAIVDELNGKQTDERFIRNLAQVLSVRIDGLMLQHAEVMENLVTDH